MAQYELARNVQYEKVDEELVILHPSGNIFILNETSGFVLEEALQCKREECIVERVLDVFAVTRKNAARDIRECLWQLEQYGVIVNT